ncbi:MAG: hypothetical protein FWG68_04850 [Defluviitaleaceae bacterium]|nr:hypothetical protein [Defluviitaleaceae bacterium]
MGRADKGTLTGDLKNKTANERRVVDDLLNQGKNVEIVPESTIQNSKTPDFKVDGVPTELKTLENINTNTGSKRIKEGFRQNAKEIILDTRGSGITKKDADEIFERLRGKYKDKKLPGKIQIWTDGEILHYF